MARRIGDDRAPVVVPARASGYCGWSIRTTAGALHREPFSHSAALARASAAWKRAEVPPLSCDRDLHEREGVELPAFGRIGLHEARHSYVSMALASGTPAANVSRYAGHSTVAFTLSRYVHARADEGEADADRLDAHLDRAASR